MPRTIQLPINGSTQTYTLGEPRSFAMPQSRFTSRVAFAAAHVVADGAEPEKIDWDATLAYRHHLWSYGFAVAEAMDTSQRGMGLSWPLAQELIRRSVNESRTRDAVVFSGAGTDHLTPSPDRKIEDVVRAYHEQFDFVQNAGGRVIMMASRALAACAKSAEDYAHVYARSLAQADAPVIIHWLGDMFDPQLAGYWGSRDITVAMKTCLAVLHENKNKIDGIKISLLDAQKEIDMRRQLPPGMRMYSGDDFNYPQLIKGDAQGYSDALLGIFDAIAPAAAAAFHALDAGDGATYDAILAPTVALSRHIFQAPTYFYKTGVTFLAYLNGFQAHFKMLGGQQTARSREHLAELFVRGDKAGLLRDPDLAVARMHDTMNA